MINDLMSISAPRFYLLVGGHDIWKHKDDRIAMEAIKLYHPIIVIG